MMEKLLKRVETLESNIFDLLLNKYILDLKKNGYVVIPKVISEEEIIVAKNLFYKWKNSIPNHDKMHSQVDPHGIYKFHQVGHQEHAWYLRSRKKIISVFKKLWNTEELVVSFDGSCYIPKEFSKNDKLWTHTDQAANSKGLQCYQSFVSLTKNCERTIVLYEGSHLMHEKYFKEKNINSSKNWNLIDETFLDKIKNCKKVLSVNPGDLVIWDSRTFHQNRYGKPNSEERLVQYLCYLPKIHIKNTKSQIEKRKKYFEELRTTSHWPYPLKVNSLQPQTYGDKSRLIDYSSLVKPDLSNYMEMIEKLI